MELKTKAAGFAAWIASTAMLAWIGESATDFIGALPDWLEAPVYGLLPAVTAWLTGYNVRHRPGSMSASAEKALRGE